MIIGLQIIGILFAFAMVYFALLHYKKGVLTKLEFYIWFMIWTITTFIVIFPELLRSFSYNIFITRLFDFMVVLAFLLFISIIALMYIRTKKLEKKLEEMVRKDALDKKNIKNKNSKK